MKLSKIKDYMKKKKIYLVCSLLLLTIASCYSTFYANFNSVGNSDNVFYSLALRQYHLHQLLVSSQHANILKLPLFILQAILPVNNFYFTLFNAGLLVVTLLAWAIILIWMFGEKLSLLIVSIFSLIIIYSSLVSNGLFGITNRNIEYLLAVAFLFCVGHVINNRGISKRQFLLISIVGLFYSIDISGDDFFLYVISVSLLVVFLLVLLSRYFGRKVDKDLLLKSLLYIVAFTVLGLIIRKFISFSGLAVFSNGGGFGNAIISPDQIIQSIDSANKALLTIVGNNLSWSHLNITNSIQLVNYLFFITGLVGLVIFIVDYIKNKVPIKINSESNIKSFVMLGLSVMFFVDYILYIVSGLAILPQANGLSDVDNVMPRYIALMPLISLVGIFYLLSNYIKTLKSLIIFTVILLFIMVINVKSVHLYNFKNDNGRQTPILVAKTAKKYNIPLLVTGYWDGASTKFWSGDTVEYVSIAACNRPAPNSPNSIDLYKNKLYTRSALVIDRNGIDSDYWNCPDKDMLKIYGKPIKIIKLNSYGKPEIWIYNYDLRTKFTKYFI